MTFYPLTPEISQKLRKANLTAAEWRFWAYLTEIDSWGDRYKDLDPLTVMTECEISKATYYRAKAKFQELELFDFQEEKVSFRNLNGISKMKQQSQEFNSSLKNETAVSEMKQQSQKSNSPSQKRENQSPEPLAAEDLESPQTYSNSIQTNQTLSEATEREKNLNFWNKMGIEEKNQVIKAAHESFLPKLPQQPALIVKWIQCNCIEIATSCGIDKNSEISPSVEILYQAQEWEIEPGIPYPNFKEERVQYWIAKGEPLETATAKAGSELRNPLIAKDLWEGFLRKCDRIADEAIKAKNMGVSTPYLPPSFTEKPPITKESVMQKLTDVSPQVLVGASTKEQLNIPESKQEENKPTIDQLQKVFDNPIGKNFVKEQIEANPDWGYEIVDGQVIEIDS